MNNVYLLNCQKMYIDIDSNYYFIFEVCLLVLYLKKIWFKIYYWNQVDDRDSKLNIYMYDCFFLLIKNLLVGLNLGCLIVCI